MTFQSFSSTYIPQIDAHLQTLVRPQTTDGRRRLEEAIAYSVLAPAKRIRPLLVLAAAQEYDADTSKVMELACSIELVHCYTLIHDDLPALDNDDFRRGQPTCHKQFDEPTAILAGDTLQSYSFEVIANRLPQHFSAERCLGVISKLAHIYGVMGLAGGQTLDLYPDFSGPLADKQQRLIQIHRLKTGALLAGCVTLPGYLFGDTDSRLALWESFGQKLGLLFQIVDDILDVTRSREELGKSAAKDVDQNKMTYVALFGLDKARQLAEDEAAGAAAVLQDLKCNSDTLSNLLEFILRREK